MVRRITLLLCAVLTISCSPRIIERVVYQRDTTQIVKIDSVRYSERDSIFVREKGDTVYKYVEHVRYRDRLRIDTVFRTKIDSVAYERINTVQVEKPLSLCQKFRIGAFWWLILLTAIGFRKEILALIKKIVNFAIWHKHTTT